jgi:hypothetical protein
LTSETTPERTGTKYVVLSLVTEEYGTQYYIEINRVTANNDMAAITAALGEDPTTGTYVAVPKRSFREREVTVESVTQTRVA